MILTNGIGRHVNALQRYIGTLVTHRSEFGHAQKWLNMTFKYIYTMGEQRLPDFGHLYGLCHVPLDNILIDALRRYDFPPLPCKWSKLADYDIYLDRQLWVRKRFPLAPLDVEFRLWMGSELPTN